MDEEKYVINITRDSELNTGKQHPKKVEDRYEINVIDSGPVVYRKWESQNKMVSDTIRPVENTWLEEFTDIPESIKGFDPVIFVENEDEVKPIDLNDGCILQFEGRYNRKVAIVEGEILSDSQARMREEATEKELPRFNEWEFRLKKVIATDGPTDREHAADSQDKKRKREEAGMFEAQKEFYQQLLTKFGNVATTPTSVEGQPTSASDVIGSVARSLDGLSEVEKRNALTLLVSELEETVDLGANEDDDERDAQEAARGAWDNPTDDAVEQEDSKPVAQVAKKVAKKTTRKK